MSRRTPSVVTGSGIETTLAMVHPARYSPEHLQVFAELLAYRVKAAGDQPYELLDLMGGAGGIHALRALLNVVTYANELEPPYVALARQLWPDCPTDQGDAGNLPHPDRRFKACVWSPDFGNRFCMPAGTLVMTLTGYRPIEELAVGDIVLTGERNWRRVTWAGQTGVQPTVEVRGQGAGTLQMTSNHPVLARWNASTYEAGHLGPAEWVSAGRLGHRSGKMARWHWAVPAGSAAPVEHAPAPAGFAYSTAFWWAVGFWLAQGWGFRTVLPNGRWRRAMVGWGHGTGRTTARHHGLLRAAFGERCKPSTVTKENTTRWAVYSEALLKWLYQHFGHLSHGKTVPGWCLALPDDWRMSLLDGYLAGDGHEHHHGAAVVTARSVSRPLLRGMQLIAHSVGRSTSFGPGKAAGLELIEGRVCNVRAAWQLRVQVEGRSKFARHDDGTDWFAVRCVGRPSEPVPVYDITVDGDHSFVAEGVVVHNSDHHNAKDPCHCRRITNPDGTPAHGPDGKRLVKAAAEPGCKRCKGFGLVMRRSYQHDLRRLTGDPTYQLDPRSSARWRADQAEFWQRQQAYCAEAFRVTEPGGIALVDVKDAIRDKKVLPVVANMANVLAVAGWRVERFVGVPAPGYRNGENRELRMSEHQVIVATKPADGAAPSFAELLARSCKA